MSKETKDRSDPRHPVVKKGALATTGVALGAVATAGTAAAQNDEDVIVLEADYRPDVDFDVVAELETRTLEDLIEDSGADDVFDDPDDWDAFIVDFDLGVEAPSWGILFTEDADLSAGDSETLGEDGAFRRSRLGLVEVEL
ncbi:calcium-binding protein [Haloarchaeobius amylolyticus]|uniref:Calcium-binding protein n=1 Tax=Haloarchaeobius amylolyticus TaxID=1198296 RepID=A0ABD6BIW9_9EURY